ncbi:response regulator [Candidatus Gracilibacteria bacterium]|nr:response regulator [Candidatus Gracilibacteria bacterium]
MNIIKILIVEDDKDISTMYKIKFQKEGFNVKVVENGLDAVTEVTEFKPHVILLDIMMPSMDGFETLRVIRELAPSLHTKIIMLSNLNSKEDIEKSMRLGANAYLLKASTTPKEVVDKVKEFFTTQEEEGKQDIKIESNKNLSEHKCPHCGKEIKITLE